MVVIEGARSERESIVDSDYFHRELFWGVFSRTVLLPQEVDVDNSSATAKDGLLTLILRSSTRRARPSSRSKRASYSVCVVSAGYGSGIFDRKREFPYGLPVSGLHQYSPASRLRVSLERIASVSGCASA